MATEIRGKLAGVSYLLAPCPSWRWNSVLVASTFTHWAIPRVHYSFIFKSSYIKCLIKVSEQNTPWSTFLNAPAVLPGLSLYPVLQGGLYKQTPNLAALRSHFLQPPTLPLLIRDIFWRSLSAQSQVAGFWMGCLHLDWAITWFKRDQLLATASCHISLELISLL